MEDVLAKTKPIPLATVSESELQRKESPLVDAVGDVESESHGDSCVEKDAASASGSSSSDELLYLDESVSASKASKEDTTTSPFGRSVKRPPRAPVCPGDPDVDGVLPSQPSIIRRMQDTNKHYVDPKDARTLLPGVLFNSNSLDLDGVLDGMENQRVQESKIPEGVLLGLLQQKELENLYLAQQRQQQQELLMAASATGVNLELLNALNEQCRVSPPGFPQRQYQQDPSNNLLIQQMINRPRHGRSVSDPTFAFADALCSMPPPFPQTPVEPAATTPIVDQSDALAFLSMNLSQPQEWMPRDLQQPAMQPNLPGLFNVPNTMQPELPKIGAGQQRRRKHGRSESADFQNKNRYSGKDRGLPTSPSSGSKSFTRAEVKRMVQQQAALGRPTYAAWFRGDRANKNNKEAEIPTEMPPSHRRALSLPQVNTTPVSPQEKQDPQNPTPKSGRAGTGVFFPRMPVPN